jgi:hypothetical protein
VDRSLHLKGLVIGLYISKDDVQDLLLINYVYRQVYIRSNSYCQDFYRFVVDEALSLYLLLKHLSIQAISVLLSSLSIIVVVGLIIRSIEAPRPYLYCRCICIHVLRHVCMLLTQDYFRFRLFVFRTIFRRLIHGSMFIFKD